MNIYKHLGQENYADLLIFGEDIYLIVVVVQLLLFEVDLRKSLIKVKYDRFLV